MKKWGQCKATKGQKLLDQTHLKIPCYLFHEHKTTLNDICNQPEKFQPYLVLSQHRKSNYFNKLTATTAGIQVTLLSSL